MLEKFRKKDGKEEELCITEEIPIKNAVYDVVYGICMGKNIRIVTVRSDIFLDESWRDSTYT